MSVITLDCWSCDLCGHHWIAEDVTRVPAQCPRCRHRAWNLSAGKHRIGDTAKQTARRTLRVGEILRFTILTGKDDLPLDTDFKVIALPEGDAEDFYRTKHHKGKRFATVGLEVIESKPEQAARKPTTHVLGTQWAGTNKMIRDSDKPTACGQDGNKVAIVDKDPTCKLCLRALKKSEQTARKPKIVAQGRTHNGLYQYRCTAAGHYWTSTAAESGGCCPRCHPPEQTAHPADEKKAFLKKFRAAKKIAMPWASKMEDHLADFDQGPNFQAEYDKATAPMLALIEEGKKRGWITTAERKRKRTAHKPLTHIPRHDAVGFALCERDGNLVTLNRRNRARLSEEATCAKCQRVRREAKKEDERQAREAEQWAKENPEDEQTAQEKS